MEKTPQTKLIRPKSLQRRSGHQRVRTSIAIDKKAIN